MRYRARRPRRCATSPESETLRYKIHALAMIVEKSQGVQPTGLVRHVCDSNVVVVARGDANIQRWIALWPRVHCHLCGEHSTLRAFATERVFRTETRCAKVERSVQRLRISCPRYQEICRICGTEIGYEKRTPNWCHDCA